MHALIGDVCGRGPAEAALGVCLRVAWRALVLAGRPPADVLSAVQLVLRHEQQDEAMFAELKSEAASALARWRELKTGEVAKFEKLSM